MTEYFVPIFSINVIRSVFLGEFYVTNELSNATCLSTTIIILRDLSISVHVWTIFSGILAQNYVHNIYKIHPKCDRFVITYLCV